MSGSEAIGDIAQGALQARAAEPAAGEGGDGHTRETVCLNCRTPLIGSHCHSCGQAAHVHKTLGAFFHDLLHGVFHFEGKIWRTLPLLAWRPGKLTREYVDGRRASYVSPIALFLFVVFLTFAAFNWIAASDGSGPPSAASLQIDAARAEAQASRDVARLEEQLAGARSAGQPTDAVEGELAGARGALEGIRAGRRGELPELDIRTGDPAWAKRISAVWREIRENPALIAYKLQSNAYKYSWLLIPLSVPFVWLLFPFSRRFGLYDHTVFVTYSLSFMLLLLAGASLAALYDVPTLPGLLLLYAPFHLYRQLRETYAVSRGGAVLRTGALGFVALAVLLLFALALLTLVLG